MGTEISNRSGAATRAWLGYGWSAVVACVAIVPLAAAVASGAMI